MNVTAAELQRLLAANPQLRLVTDGYTTTVEPRPMPAAKLSEHELQRRVVAECDRRAQTDARYGMLLAVPNGQYRHGQRMEPGLRAGVPDLLLPVPVGQYHGLWLELKVTPNKPSKLQLEWMRRLRGQGYKCVVVWDDPQRVIQTIEEYLGDEA